MKGKRSYDLVWDSWIRPVLEALYFLAGIGLFATVFIALKQLRLLKEDMRTKNKRASVEKSIEYLHWFSTDFIPKTNPILDSLIGVHNAESFIDNMNREFVFDDKVSPTNTEVVNMIVACRDLGAVDILNQLEYFSSTMTSGLADEELAFNPLSTIYCDITERLYPLICEFRKEGNTKMFSNIVKLYGIWKDRVEKIDLESKRSDIESRLSKFTEERISSIGS
jgi:hypothetical protein